MCRSCVIEILNQRISFWWTRGISSQLDSLILDLVVINRSWGGNLVLLITLPQKYLKTRNTQTNVMFGLSELYCIFCWLAHHRSQGRLPSKSLIESKLGNIILKGSSCRSAVKRLLSFFSNFFRKIQMRELLRRKLTDTSGLKERYLSKDFNGRSTLQCYRISNGSLMQVF